MSGTITIKLVEITHLCLSYAHTRIERPRQIIRMADSLKRYGQLSPIVVVADKHPQFVLMDGYLRVGAAHICRLDTLTAHVWPVEQKEALCQVLAKDAARQFDPFEQGAMLRELLNTHQLTQRQIARQIGRHPSWVTRRLSLLDALSPTAVAAVRRGDLSSWAACRVIAPLARANGEHADALVDAIKRQGVSTRQLETFWNHYQRANRAVRQNMIADPGLFFKSIQAKDNQKCAKRIKDGPEESWRHDACIVRHILRRLAQNAPTVLYPGQRGLDRTVLLTAFSDTQTAWKQLSSAMRKLADEKRTRSPSRAGHATGRMQHQEDCPADEDVQKNRAPHPCRQASAGNRAAQPL